jgi:hypothetical protein
MARILTKATEKDEVGKVKLKGIEYEDLHKFLSSQLLVRLDQSAVYQFPKEHRKAMERIFKVLVGVSVSLVNHYKSLKGISLSRFILVNIIIIYEIVNIYDQVLNISERL